MNVGTMINAGGTTHADTWQSEMTVAINPTNPLQVVGVSHRIRDPAADFDIEVFRSTDGGNTWASNPPVLLSAKDGLGTQHRFDPTVTFDSGGRLYIGYGCEQLDALRVITSDDGEATFLNNGVTVDSGGTVDKWHLASGPRGDGSGNPAVYIAYLKLLPGPGQVLVAGSIDRGATWTKTATRIDGSGNPTFPHPAVGPAGQLYVSWHNQTTHTISLYSDPNGLEGGFASSTAVIARNLLTDTGNGVVVPAQPIRRIYNAPTIFVDRSAGPNNGRIYITFIDRDVGAASYNFDTFLTVSDDQGQHWKNPNTGAQMPDPLAALRVENPTSTEFNPWVAVDQTSGLVGIAYYSSQIDPNGGDDDVGYRIAYSNNGGSTFTFGWLSGSNTSNEGGGNFGLDYLEYSGLALHGGTAHGFWAFEPSAGSNDLDAFTARASFNSSSDGNVLTLTGDDNGTATNDTIELRLSAANSAYLEVTVNNVLQYAGLLATLDSISIDGRAGNDTVFFNFANGNLLTGLVSVSLIGGIGTDLAKATADQNMTLSNTLLTIGNFGSVALTSEIEGATLTGGNSANTISAAAFSNGAVTLSGAAGNDTLTGGAGNDTINGDAGDDTMLASGAADGADVFNGGANSDTADYSLRSSGVTVSVDGVANDGATGEYDNIKTDVETVKGSDHADTLNGGFSSVTLIGNLGNDVLHGGDGNDSLDGGGDADTIVGNGGMDVIFGGPGNDLIYGDSDDPNYTGGSGDTIDGGTGDDYCYGGPGDDDITGGDDFDHLLGEDGNDTFHAQDGKQDIIGGGNGTDTCLLSQRDGNDLLTSVEVY